MLNPIWHIRKICRFCPASLQLQDDAEKRRKPFSTKIRKHGTPSSNKMHHARQGQLLFSYIFVIFDRRNLRNRLI